MIFSCEIKKLNRKYIKVVCRDNISYTFNSYRVENDCIVGTLNGEFGRIIPFSAIIAIEYKM